jgi:hypothetical protein
MEKNNKFLFLEFWIHENHDQLSKTYKVGANKLELQLATLNENIDGINSWAAIQWIFLIF